MSLQWSEKGSNVTSHISDSESDTKISEHKSTQRAVCHVNCLITQGFYVRHIIFCVNRDMMQLCVYVKLSEIFTFFI